jgi:hypothetical protein
MSFQIKFPKKNQEEVEYESCSDEELNDDEPILHTKTLAEYLNSSSSTSTNFTPSTLEKYWSRSVFGPQSFSALLVADLQSLANCF